MDNQSPIQYDQIQLCAENGIEKTYLNIFIYLSRQTCSEVFLKMYEMKVRANITGHHYKLFNISCTVSIFHGHSAEMMAAAEVSYLTSTIFHG